MARRSTTGATELPAKAVEITAPSIQAIITGSPEIQLRSPASRVTPLGQMRWSWRVASLRRKPSRPREQAKSLKVVNRLART
jgi:hypothetical protein